jgi:hypothetical protein
MPGNLGSKHIMALQQCHYPDDAYFTGNFQLLDFHINTAKDVDFGT